MRDEGTSHNLGGHREEAPRSPKLSGQPYEPSILLSFLSEGKIRKKKAKETREERDELGRQKVGECTWQITGRARR